jgi:hypothetical protein
MAVFASAARYFVVIAPTTTHESQRECNFSSYNKQGWCRLEQWARLSSGAHNVHVYDDDAKLRPLSMSDSLLQCTHVYEGDFANKSDKKKVAKAVLNIWAKTLHNSSENETAKRLYEFVMASTKESVFPHDLFGDIPWKLASTLVEAAKDLEGKGKTNIFGRFGVRNASSRGSFGTELFLAPPRRSESDHLQA